MIKIENLQKIVDGNTLVDINDLSIATGECAGVIGPVGSGKTVLFDLMIGRKRPTAGNIRIDDIDPYSDKIQFSRKVGVLFAQDGIYKHRSPRDNLIFYCRLRGLPKSRAEAVLAEVGLADQAKAKTEKLPSGLTRRLAFGIASLHQPKQLILVEPFARCDDATISLLSDRIQQLAEEGCTILIFADDETYLENFCDSIYRLSQGRVISAERPSEEQPASMPFKIPVRLEGRVALINPADILYAEVVEGRAYLNTLEDRYPSQYTLVELEERLSRSGFFRAHRSYLVNLQHIKEVIPFTRNSFSLRLNDPEGTLIPLSKSSASELKDLLGY